MWGTSKGKIKQPESKPVPDLQRCEASTDDEFNYTSRCPRQGELYKLEGVLATGFSRLCERHLKVFERRGYKVSPATALDREQLLG